MAPTVLHLRSETKPLEHRSALTPSTAKALLEAGYTVNVERSPVRIFKDDEFEAVGATLVPEGSWSKAPEEHIIIGLKELLEEDFPLHHEHIQFAHCYKQQDNWAKTLSRYSNGGGTLYDLEFLTDPSTNARVAAFGYWAGFAGAALAILNWSHQLLNPDKPLGSISSYPDEPTLIAGIKTALARATPLNNNQLPRIIIIGALGRCGRGAIDMCTAVGIPASSLLKWDMAETAKGGPFDEVFSSDIFINCIYLMQPIPPFTTAAELSKPGRKLSVVCDVSCDPNNPHNPIPIYSEWSTFDKPTLPVKLEGEGAKGTPLSVISIDHLPSLLPREASETFSEQLLPYLKTLDRRREEPVWMKAEQLYRDKVAEIPKV